MFELTLDVVSVVLTLTSLYVLYLLHQDNKKLYQRGYDAGRLDAAKESYQKTLQRRFDDLDKD